MSQFKPDHFDVAVVGTGYGGAIAAERAASAGHSVCVLERGRAYPPGSFPRTRDAVAGALWDPDQDRFGLFELQDLGLIRALVASGLGGGSLIDAGVLARPAFDAALLADGSLTLGHLEPHYAAVARELDPQRVEAEAVPRARALEDAADHLGAAWEHEPLAIRFGTAPGDPLIELHPNVHARTRYTCRHVAECSIGCNYGAKDSLDFTLLGRAVEGDTWLRTSVEVLDIRHRSNGSYELRCVDRVAVEGMSGRDLSSKLTADKVFVAAGALGSTQLLMRSRRGLPGLSRRLGWSFSVNGASVFGVGSVPFNATPGPVTTTALTVPVAEDAQVVVRDGGVSTFQRWMAELVGAGWDSRVGLFLQTSSADSRMLTLRFDGVRLGVAADNLELPATARDAADAVAHALGSELVDAPELPALQPVGGCALGRTPAEGVVDPWGEVFGHPGLYVCDGALLPFSLSTPPALTIAALADYVVGAALSHGSDEGTSVVAASPGRGRSHVRS